MKETMKDKIENIKKVSFTNIKINDSNIHLYGVIYSLKKNVEHFFVESHRHQFYEFCYVLDGSFNTVVNNKKTTMNKGYFHLVPSKVFHSHYHETNKNLHELVAIRWGVEENNHQDSSNSFNFIFNRLKSLPCFPVYDDGTVLNAINCFLDNSQNHPVLEIQLGLCALIYDICDYYIQHQLLPDNNMDQSENSVINKVILFIEGNYYYDISVHDISSNVHLSYSHLHRIFKKHTGESIYSYLIKFRLRKAQLSLVSTNKKLNDIASEVGFSSQNHFCNAFKTHFGISPNTYRKSKTRLEE